MKKITFIVFVVYSCLFSSSAFAQDKDLRNADKERFKHEKMAYLIKEVGLTTEESGLFFPIYNEMQDKIFNLQRDVRERTKDFRKNQDKITDKEYLDAVDKLIMIECNQAELESKYYKQFGKILSPKKLYKLKIAERMYPLHLFRRHNSPIPHPPIR
ncbi:MAG: hypothetical protein ACRC6R_03730 [Bacteroidales bacterium]